MSDYTESLEKHIEELQKQLVNLSYVIQPHFKIFKNTKKDRVEAIQLFMDLKESTDPINPFNEWKVAFTETSDRTLIATAQLVDNIWNLTLRRNGDVKLIIKDASVADIKHALLDNYGMVGFKYEEHTEIYRENDERLKSKLINSGMIDHISKNSLLKDWVENNNTTSVWTNAAWTNINDTTK